MKAPDKTHKIPLFLMLCLRPLHGRAFAQNKSLLSLPGATIWQLEGMNDGESQELVCQVLTVKSFLPHPLLIQCIEKAQGNPFFIREMALQMKSSESLDVLNEADSFPIPDTIHGIILSRLDRLGTSCQLVLKVASVIGEEFRYEQLHAIFPIEEEKPHLQMYIQQLIEQEFVCLPFNPLDSKDQSNVYIFKSSIVSQVCYELMTFSQRQSLHKEFAVWLENEYKDDLSPFRSTLAHHWTKQQLYQVVQLILG